MQKILFQLGHQPHISLAEIRLLLERERIPFDVIEKNQEVAIFEVDGVINAPELMHWLGGTRSIAVHVPKKYPTIHEVIADDLISTHPEGKIAYAILGTTPPKLWLDVKKLLREAGRNGRHVENANAATILHNHLLEKQGVFFLNAGEVYRLVALQPIDDFAERDFGRPKSDDKSGMLPPKLARTMITLSGKKEGVFLDPFCGSGTVLLEARTLGYTTIFGSDTSPKAVSDSLANMRWYEEKHPGAPKATVTISQADATRLETHLPKDSVDLIISEPFLGVPKHGGEAAPLLQKEVSELTTLYRKSFTAFQTILRSKGMVVFIFPVFFTKQGALETFDSTILSDNHFRLVPFSTGDTSLLYRRPNQHTGRRLVRAEKIS